MRPRERETLRDYFARKHARSLWILAAVVGVVWVVYSFGGFR